MAKRSTGKKTAKKAPRKKGGKELYRVKKCEDGWALYKKGTKRALKRADKKSEAVAEGKKRAKSRGAALHVLKSDGEVQQKFSF